MTDDGPGRAPGPTWDRSRPWMAQAPSPLSCPPLRPGGDSITCQSPTETWLSLTSSGWDREAGWWLGAAWVTRGRKGCGHGGSGGRLPGLVRGRRPAPDAHPQEGRRPAPRGRLLLNVCLVQKRSPWGTDRGTFRQGTGDGEGNERGARFRGRRRWPAGRPLPPFPTPGGDHLRCASSPRL